MTEEMKDMTLIESEDPAPLNTDEEKRSIRRIFSRCGWSSTVFCIGTIVISLVLSVIFGVLIASGVDVMGFYEKNLLYFNEAIIAISALLAALVLIGTPKAAPEKKKMPAKEFMAIVCICFAVGMVGSLIGNIWLTFWNGIAGNEVTNPVQELLEGIGPFQMILCTAVLAPVLEELAEEQERKTPKMLRNTRTRPGWAEDAVRQLLIRYSTSPRIQFGFFRKDILLIEWSPERLELLLQMYPGVPWVDLSEKKKLDAERGQ